MRQIWFGTFVWTSKLMAIRRRLQGVQEWSAAQIELLTAADTKLTAAIVAALLSTRGNG
ncbi:hypothetical protein SAMN05444158_1463 [Bradyrhizobium canariense]|uniref:Uncharacterized protein n=1 Tax=Bradyrhizobium canariense TaxID=255045 RepID=A0A1H1QMW5_9BRAD|nr:hypothetical protein SAMN05444158_1463 [Bradyrhizobium canariense]